MPKSRIKRGSADRISTPKITLPVKRDDEVVFSFKYLHKVSFDKTKKSDFFVEVHSATTGFKFLGLGRDQSQ